MKVLLHMAKNKQSIPLKTLTKILYILLLDVWARDGLTDEQIAKNMGICRDTLIQWKKRFPDISDTLKSAKAY